MEGERCNNMLKSEDGHSRRCPNTATYYLMNGSQLQSKACEECAQQVVKETKWLTARPIR